MKGVSLCHPHKYHQCGAQVDHLAIHGLSCRKSQGRFSGHTAINDIIKCSLGTAKVPSLLEPSGISRSDGKRPDVATTIPWKRGHILVWDATCRDTFAPSHSSIILNGPGAVANHAERLKIEKYKDIAVTHLFVPIGIETTGVLGSEARNFLHELALRLKAETGERRSHHYLLQRIAVAVQRGNAASVLGSSNDFHDDFLIF